MASFWIICSLFSGGDAHTDVHGVHYSKDPLSDREIGIASDFGRSLIIARVPPADQVASYTSNILIKTASCKVMWIIT